MHPSVFGCKFTNAVRGGGHSCFFCRHRRCFTTNEASAKAAGADYALLLSFSVRAVCTALENGDAFATVPRRNSCRALQCAFAPHDPNPAKISTYFQGLAPPSELVTARLWCYGYERSCRCCNACIGGSGCNSIHRKAVLDNIDLCVISLRSKLTTVIVGALVCQGLQDRQSTSGSYKCELDGRLE